MHGLIGAFQPTSSATSCSTDEVFSSKASGSTCSAYTVCMCCWRKRRNGPLPRWPNCGLDAWML